MHAGRLIAAMGAALILPAAGAQAADMIYETPAPLYGGWYFRGDIGFSNQKVGSLYNVLYEGTTIENLYKDFDAAPLLAVGLGYQFNDWFRFDVTGEYRGNATFHGMDRYLFEDGPDNWVWRPDEYSGSKSEWTFLANGYVDLGTWHGFTPFLGAGVGTSYNIFSNFQDIDPTSGNTYGPSLAYAGTAGKWNFAWALYAGVGFQVTEKLTLEVAYRYINLGSAQTADVVPYDGPGYIDNPMHFNNLTSNDLKIGFRFKFN